MKFRKGSALLLVVCVSSLLMLVAIASSVNAISDINLTSDEKYKTMLQFACESAVNRAKAKIEESYNNNDLTSLEPIVSFQGLFSDDTGLTPEEKAYDDEEYNSDGGNYYYGYSFDDGNNNEIFVKYSITDDQNWKKSQSYTSKSMNIEAIAYIPNKGWVGMNEKIIARRTTLFMYQVFFQNDLEILPGPNFNLKGLIHTNENLYLNANNTLSIYTDSITSAKSIYRGRLDSTSVSGTVNISKGSKIGTLTSMGSIDDSKNTNWTNVATNKWNGTVRDSALGATRLEAPKLESFEPGGYYDTNANLNIKVRASGKTLTNTLYDITLNGATKTYTSTQLSGALKDVNMYDRREYGTTKQIRVTEIDIAKLSTTLGYPDNGIVYMTRDDAKADSDNNPYVADSSRVVSGFKLKNGSQLPEASTFVSNLPTYIQGDFNLHTSTNPSTDKWQPCAVVSDAITLLSNTWDNTKSNSTQVASNTTYNTVFITGNVPTKTGQYSGGLENFPRFLEDWTNKNANIAGGFIQLFRSKYATGPWGGSYYSAPNRNWSSEDRFNDLQSLPPGYANLFPSTNLGLAYSSWKQMNKEDATLTDD